MEGTILNHNGPVSFRVKLLDGSVWKQNTDYVIHSAVDISWSFIHGSANTLEHDTILVCDSGQVARSQSLQLHGWVINAIAHAPGEIEI